MRDFMPCKGCDEPEACEIEGRCLESAHVMSALNAGVQRADALTEAELVLLDRILEGFADCGETDEGHDVLLNFARRGYLECERYAPTDKSHQALAAWRAGGVGEVPGG